MLATAFQKADWRFSVAPSGPGVHSLFKMAKQNRGGHNQGGSVFSLGGLCRSLHHKCT